MMAEVGGTENADASLGQARCVRLYLLIIAKCPPFCPLQATTDAKKGQKGPVSLLSGNSNKTKMSPHWLASPYASPHCSTLEN